MCEEKDVQRVTENDETRDVHTRVLEVPPSEYSEQSRLNQVRLKSPSTYHDHSIAFSFLFIHCMCTCKVIELPVPQAKFLVQVSFQLHSISMLLDVQALKPAAKAAPPLRAVQCFDPVLEHFLHDNDRRM